MRFAITFALALALGAAALKKLVTNERSRRDLLAALERGNLFIVPPAGAAAAPTTRATRASHRVVESVSVYGPVATVALAEPDAEVDPAPDRSTRA